MAVRKIAISVPEDVLNGVDRLARKSKTTRSGLITRVLRQVSHASTQAEITEQINRLFEDSPDARSLAEEQTSTAKVYLTAAESKKLGSDW